MKTIAGRMYVDDYTQIKNWGDTKGNSIAETVHALVKMAKSAQYQRQYERSLEICVQKQGADKK